MALGGISGPVLSLPNISSSMVAGYHLPCHLFLAFGDNPQGET